MIYSVHGAYGYIVVDFFWSQVIFGPQPQLLMFSLGTLLVSCLLVVYVVDDENISYGLFRLFVDL